MGTRISFIFLLFLCSIPFGLINLVPSFKGNMPDTLHIATSIIAVVLLFIVGLLFGYTGQSFFVRWYSLYWGVGFLFLALGYITKWFVILFPFAFIYAFPLYGLRHFLKMPSDLPFIAFSITIAIIAGLAGYFAGLFRHQKASPVAEP